MSEQRSWKDRRLRLLALSLASVISLALGIILVTRDGELRAGEVQSAIGLNLISAVIFAVIFTRLSTSGHQRLLYESFIEHSQRLSNKFTDHARLLSEELIQQFAGYNSDYLPIARFAAKESFDPAFNRAINQSLHESRLYAFRGASAKYVPVRVKAIQPPLERLQVAILDPSSDRALRRRASDRLKQPQHRSRSMNEVIERLREEILDSLVALFDCRRICPVDVSLSAETGVMRIEIFDDSMFVSWYQDPESSKTNFPEAQQFRVGSFLYRILRMDLVRRFEVSERTMTFTAQQDEAVISAYLSQLTGKACMPDDIIRRRERNAAFFTKVAPSITDV